MDLPVWLDVHHAGPRGKKDRWLPLVLLTRQGRLAVKAGSSMNAADFELGWPSATDQLFGWIEAGLPGQLVSRPCTTTGLGCILRELLQGAGNR